MAMTHPKLIPLLHRINDLIFPLEHENDIQKNRSALFNGDSLYSGNLGLVLYHYNYYKVFKDPVSKDRALTLLQNILDRVVEGRSTLSNYTLSYGLSGLGIVLKLLINEQLVDEDDIDIGNLDELVYEWAVDRIKNDDSEFMHGACGAIQYLSLYNETGAPAHSFEPLVDEILSRAVPDEHTGVYLNMFNQFIPEYPKGSINLSFSHGMSGVLFLLLNLIDKGLISETYKQSVREIVKYLEARIEEVDFSRNLFCHADVIVSDDITARRNTRLAWCYGDLNQVMAFLRAGQSLDDENYLSLSNKIGLTTTRRREFPQTYVSDSQFCHGSSGLVQVFDYLHEQTGLQAYQEAKEYWLNDTLIRLETELDSNYYHEKRRTGELLEGLPGVAMVLLSELGKTQQLKLSWNSIFLLS